MHAADAAKRGFGGRLIAANKLASNLSPVADELEEVASAYEDRVSRIDAGMRCLLDAVEEDPRQLADMEPFAVQLTTFAGIIRNANEKQARFATTIVGAGKFSKPLRIATRRIADATNRCSSAISVAEVWSLRLEQLMSKHMSQTPAVDSPVP